MQREAVPVKPLGEVALERRRAPGLGAGPRGWCLRSGRGPGCSRPAGPVLTGGGDLPPQELPKGATQEAGGGEPLEGSGGCGARRGGRLDPCTVLCPFSCFNPHTLGWGRA